MGVQDHDQGPSYSTTPPLGLGAAWAWPGCWTLRALHCGA